MYNNCFKLQSIDFIHRSFFIIDKFEENYSSPVFCTINLYYRFYFPLFYFFLLPCFIFFFFFFLDVKRMKIYYNE